MTARSEEGRAFNEEAVEQCFSRVRMLGRLFAFTWRAGSKRRTDGERQEGSLEADQGVLAVRQNTRTSGGRREQVGRDWQAT